MNTTQTIAWLICLVLAFTATIMAARANYQAALTEQRFDQVQRVAGDQQELLGQIRDVLQQINQHMGGQPPAVQAEAPAAETAATWQAAPEPSE